MGKLIQIAVYVKEEDRDLLERACSFIGLNKGAFCRSVSLIEARRILGYSGELKNSDKDSEEEIVP